MILLAATAVSTRFGIAANEASIEAARLSEQADDAARRANLEAQEAIRQRDRALNAEENLAQE